MSSIPHTEHSCPSRAATASVIAITTAFAPIPAFAGISYTFSQPTWTAAAGGAGATSFVDFNTLPNFTVVTEQFSSLGVHFTDGDDVSALTQWPPVGFFNALFSWPYWQGGSPSGITLVFDSPQQSLGITIGFDQFTLTFFSGQNELATLTAVNVPSGGFLGFLSDTAFDRVIFHSYPVQNYTVLSSFYFSQVPAPGAGLLLVFGAARLRRRRSN